MPDRSCGGSISRCMRDLGRQAGGGGGGPFPAAPAPGGGRGGGGASGSDGHALVARVKTSYAGRPFVRVLDQAPELTHAVGTNYALIHAAASDDGTEIQVMIAIDNLIKGAGGQAVQAMNLALGLPEQAGLGATGMFPC